MADPDAQTREQARESLKRMQNFDVESLAREQDLGSRFHFREAVESASRLVDLYRRLPESVLADLPATPLQTIRDRANEHFNRFDEILKFDPAQQNAPQVRTSLINNLRTAYEPAFQALHPYISYSLQKTADFRRLESEARAALQTIRDEASKLTEALNKDKEAAGKILEEIRKTAAEQGVSQQAIYFKEAADQHESEAKRWQWTTVWIAVGLALYALLSTTFHKIPWLAPEDTYQAVQLAVSKVLVFAVISYVLYLAGRNFISHTHNTIINRHRQNALMTYKALVEAAGNTPNREVVLVQAAACIFSPQGTGYTHDNLPHPPGAQSVVEFLTKPLKGGG